MSVNKLKQRDQLSSKIFEGMKQVPAEAKGAVLALSLTVVVAIAVTMSLGKIGLYYISESIKKG